MGNCKECGNEYEVGIKDCCSEECYKKDIQKRIEIATKNDSSHTKEISNGSSC